MTRIAIFVTSIATLTSCAQYQEPQANCFSFIAATEHSKPDCSFVALSTREADRGR